ncbi:MAG: NADPH:quinone oxidoreductase family protein [Hyphomicrobiaceae bacterium]
MRAALIKSLDGPDGIVVADIAVPHAGPGQLLVRVEAAALNFMDTLISRGRYQVRPALPFSPSGEIAGIVESIGGGTTCDAGLRVGDRVAAYVGHGGAREMAVVPIERAVLVPDGVASDIAAGVSVTYGTAMHGLVDRGRLAAGETVAVLGASGGAGLAATEVARLIGARVIACASAGKADVCRQHGADVFIDYDSTPLKEALREATAGRGVDMVYDCVGGRHAEPALRATAWQGRYLVVGFAAGDIPALPLNHVMLRGVDVLGVNWGEAVSRAPEAHRAAMRQVLGWIAEGRLAPRIHAKYPLSEIADAIRALDARAVAGKVVITMMPDADERAGTGGCR